MRSALKALGLVLSFGLVACGGQETPVESDRAVTDSNSERSGADAASCRMHFPKSALCGDLTWVMKPTLSSTGTFLLKFDQPVEFRVALWMPSMGHPSSKEARIEALRDADGRAIPGAFQVSNVYFNMPGDWQIRIQLLQGNAVVEEALLALQI